MSLARRVQAFFLNYTFKSSAFQVFAHTLFFLSFFSYSCPPFLTGDTGANRRERLGPREKALRGERERERREVARKTEELTGEHQSENSNGLACTRISLLSFRTHPSLTPLTSPPHYKLQTKQMFWAWNAAATTRPDFPHLSFLHQLPSASALPPAKPERQLPEALPSPHSSSSCSETAALASDPRSCGSPKEEPEGMAQLRRGACWEEEEEHGDEAPRTLRPPPPPPPLSTLPPPLPPPLLPPTAACCITSLPSVHPASLEPIPLSSLPPMNGEGDDDEGAALAGLFGSGAGSGGGGDGQQQARPLPVVTPFSLAEPASGIAAAAALVSSGYSYENATAAAEQQQKQNEYERELLPSSFPPSLPASLFYDSGSGSDGSGGSSGCSHGAAVVTTGSLGERRRSDRGIARAAAALATGVSGDGGGGGLEQQQQQQRRTAAAALVAAASGSRGGASQGVTIRLPPSFNNFAGGSGSFPSSFSATSDAATAALAAVTGASFPRGAPSTCCTATRHHHHTSAVLSFFAPASAGGEGEGRSLLEEETIPITISSAAAAAAAASSAAAASASASVTAVASSSPPRSLESRCMLSLAPAPHNHGATAKRRPALPILGILSSAAASAANGDRGQSAINSSLLPRLPLPPPPPSSPVRRGRKRRVDPVLVEAEDGSVLAVTPKEYRRLRRRVTNRLSARRVRQRRAEERNISSSSRQQQQPGTRTVTGTGEEAEGLRLRVAD